MTTANFDSVLDPDNSWIIETRIFEIVTAYLNSSDGQQRTTAHAICSLFPLLRESDETKESPESFLWETWDLFFRIAERIDFEDPAQQKLAGLIECMRDTSDELGEPTASYFQHLTIMSMALTERLMQLNPDPAASSADTLARWAALNGFAARLTQMKLCDRSSDAVIALSLALEQRSHTLACTRREWLKAHVPIAERYMTLCGSSLFALVDSQDFEGGSPWQGKRGIAMARWSNWFERLRVMSHDEGLSLPTSRFAESARRAMLRAEIEGA